MRIDERVFGDVTILTMQGKIVLDEGHDLLRDTINNLVGQGRKKLVLDWADVPYIDSAGLQETVRAYMTCSRQGVSLKFCNLTPRLTDLFSITKLLTVFDTYDSIDDAVATFSTTRFEVSCPACKPLTWIAYVGTRFLLSCTDCDARFSPRVSPDTFAPLEETSADASRVVTAPVSDLWWFTYYENGYGPEGVHLTLAPPSTVAISGRLDLFAFDVVRMAWDAVPRPRRVLFDTTHVRLASPAGQARLDQLCASTDASRSVVVATPGERDRAIAALGSLENAAQSIDVRIRRRA
jgi:anti-sigma B factor antagonist